MNSSLHGKRLETINVKVALLTILLGIIIPLIALEWWSTQHLFNHASYTNSINLDKQLKALEKEAGWNTIALGSSEVRWGFSPSEFDKAMKENSWAEAPLNIKSFNLGIDGFSPGLVYSLLNRIDLKALAPELQLLLIGVNITENNTMSDQGYIPGSCAALQKPILTSSFAIDHGLDIACTKPSWKDSVINVFELLHIVRYRKALRSYLLPGDSSNYIGMQSTGLDHAADGFQPHQSISEAYDNFKSSWDRLVADKKNHPERFAPLPVKNYPQFLQKGSFFDKWRQFGEQQNIKIVFFALPTNPMLIDIYDRRDDYHRHSALITKWANENNVVYLDLDIKDEYEKNRDFSDHRHLSQYGAPKFSRELAEALSEKTGFLQIFQEGVGYAKKPIKMSFR